MTEGNSITPMTAHQSAREIPVLGDYDVVVCGGGPAGCAAGLAAARHGARTLLVEKYGYLGGAAVAQLVSVVLSTNGVDFQGVWHTWARRRQTMGAMAPLIRMPSHFYPDCAWYRSSVDAEADVILRPLSGQRRLTSISRRTPPVDNTAVVLAYCQLRGMLSVLHVTLQ